MGDISEMMLEGTLCEECGAFIEDGDGEGYPRKCEDCEPKKKKKKKKS